MTSASPLPSSATNMRTRGIRAMLRRWSLGNLQDDVSISQLLHGLGRRTFGMLLLISILPAFIPIPIGGAISGPLVILMGLQYLAGRRRPWLPKFIARRSFKRETLHHFSLRIDKWLTQLERFLHRRLRWVLEHPLSIRFTGLLLLLLGVLLSLPIPLTNYLFGVLLLLYALALLERDGGLMLVAWLAGIIAIASFATAFVELGAWLLHWLTA